ncbi:HAD-IIB family hydrolase [Pandoraea fibrosis]|uniref:HAD family hydrolase n=1 Tax=Pandoraea fibrosis TaxID=1891094 RepID=A0A5E4UR80_9BURK|nr:HAD-IIB family hydrolase [Pandoraea fibrosis]VVE02466.1 HAD family hydrolase [Pandoraea fibrosis]
MRHLSVAAAHEFKDVRFVLTDMDETLTYRGRLAADTYCALENLQKAGVRVIPVTAAPAGWCDQMARMWPVDGVIGENGGLFLQRTPDGHGIQRTFWHAESEIESVSEQLDAAANAVSNALPYAQLADDQVFRLTSVAFSRPADPAAGEQILRELQRAGADATINNLWVLGWFGGYDKLSMTRRVMAEAYGVDIDKDRDTVLYTGDSTNDAPMFAFFKHTVGMSTVKEYLPHISVPPNWITTGPGGQGFIEAAQAVIASRAS